MLFTVYCGVAVDTLFFKLESFVNWYTNSATDRTILGAAECKRKRVP